MCWQKVKLFLFRIPRPEQTMEQVINRAQRRLEARISKKHAGNTLDENARIALKQFKKIDRNLARLRYIRSTESEVRDLVREGKTDKQIMQPCYDSKPYQDMLEYLGFSMENVKIMVREARKNNKKAVTMK